jgi:hypothetical protein
MGRYRLIAGKHYGPDMTKEVDERGRRPSRKYSPGEVIESSVDLVKVHGENKFQYVGPHKEDVGDQPVAVAPGGQVSSGLQQTKGGVTGPMEMTLPSQKPASASVNPAVQSGKPRNVDVTYGRLEDMKVEDLRDIASENKIDLHGAKTKEEMVKKIRSDFK